MRTRRWGDIVIVEALFMEALVMETSHMETPLQRQNYPYLYGDQGLSFLGPSTWMNDLLCVASQACLIVLTGQLIMTTLA
jgi:hypothetical protein